MLIEQTNKKPLSERVAKENLQSDIIIKKRQIKDILYKDPAIIEALNNDELELSSPDEYLNINIFSYLRIPGVQDTTKNYICFEIDDVDVSTESNILKTQYLTVICMANESNIITEFDGINRHDLLGYLIIDNLNWTNFLGMQLKLVSNRSDIIDQKYHSRILKFLIKAPNGIENGGKGRYDKFIQG